MSAVYQLNNKKCATCNWWGGPRSTNYTKTQIITEGQNPKGNCNCYRGINHNKVEPEYIYCNSWEGWVK